MDIRMPGNLQSLLGARFNAPGNTGGVRGPTPPGEGGQTSPTPMPTPGEPGQPIETKPEPAPDDQGFRGRIKIASLMPFLQGKPMFRGPLSGELGELADRARDKLDQVPADQSGRETMRALRDHLNGALQELYAQHEPGEPIDRQAAVETLSSAFDEFLAGMSGDEAAEAGDEQAVEDGASGTGDSQTVISGQPGAADGGMTQPEATSDDAADAASAPADDADPADAGSAATQEEPADSDFVSGDQIGTALGQWLDSLQERLDERMTDRDRAWSQWLTQVDGFYAGSGTQTLLSALDGAGGFDDRA